jgi:glycine cleavage system regulatory protein
MPSRTSSRGICSVASISPSASRSRGLAPGVARTKSAAGVRSSSRLSALALLRGVEVLIGVSVDVSELESSAADYERQAGLAIAATRTSSRRRTAGAGGG